MTLSGRAAALAVIAPALILTAAPASAGECEEAVGRTDDVNECFYNGMAPSPSGWDPYSFGPGA
ncbi:hypothetical protein ACFO4E_11880 [Nocardiopsis mangrovi]|uniref:Uncharacterized protein n=1 Tax=Nocardiopsis mangrovi TaxID=1179818 RepID=A0ABV9DW35_9ACTN